MSIGKIISVSDLMVEAFVAGEPLKRRDMLYAEDGGRRYEFEVQDIKGAVASLVPFGSCKGLHRGVEVFKSPRGLEIEYSAAILFLDVYSTHMESLLTRNHLNPRIQERYTRKAFP
mgnify:CR=1 FL=1